jgi:hypothetical protein
MRRGEFAMIQKAFPDSYVCAAQKLVDAEILV